MVLLVNILNKYILTTQDKDFVVPNIMEKDEIQTFKAIKLEGEIKTECFVNIICKDVFKGVKTHTFKRARRNTLHKKIGKRNVYNLVCVIQ
jgi:hypothetical protein